MLPEFEYFIKNNCSEHIRTILETSLDLFDQFNLEEHQDRLMNLLMQEGIKERSVLDIEFIAMINKYADSLLTLHGIKLDIDTQLEFKNGVLQTILDLSNYIDTQTILDILELQEENTEKFTQLLELFLPYSNSHIFAQLEEVQDSFLVKLKEYTLSQVELSLADAEEETSNNDIITKLKILYKLLNNPTLLGFRLIDQGVALGLDFTFYSKYAVRHFDLLTPEEVARELIVLLSMSLNGYNNPIMTFRENSQNMFVDLDRITKVDVQLNKLLAEYDKLKLSLTIQTIETKNEKE